MNSHGKQCYAVTAPDGEYLADKYVRVLKDGLVSMDMAQNILVIKTVSGMAMAVAIHQHNCLFHTSDGAHNCVVSRDTSHNLMKLHCIKRRRH